MVIGYFMVGCAAVILNSVCDGLSDWRWWAIHLLYIIGCGFIHRKAYKK